MRLARRKTVWTAFLVLVGFVSALFALALVQLLKERGFLRPLGWIALAATLVMLALTGALLSRRAGPSTRDYHRLREGSALADPERFVSTVRDLARTYGEGLSASGASLSLTDVSQALTRQAEHLKGDSDAFARATALVGELLRDSLGAAWCITRRRNGREAVLRIGKGRTRHYISPGELVYRMSLDGSFPLEEVVRHELSELGRGPAMGASHSSD